MLYFCRNNSTCWMTRVDELEKDQLEQENDTNKKHNNESEIYFYFYKIE